MFAFGKKHPGERLEEVARTDPDYLGWILKDDFSDEVKLVVRQALEREQAMSGAVAEVR